MTAFRTAVLGAAFAALAASAHAAPGPPDGVGDPRLEGFWNIDDEARRAATATLKAELTPAGQEIARRNAAAQAERVARGELVALAAATCGNIGVPFIVGTSEPWLLTVTKDMVLQTAERYQLTPRAFYTDGRAWPDLSKMPPSSNGYSIARWEGRDLVIETRGLPPGGTQGGGLKGPKSILIERASLTADGNRLTWTYSWEDPDLLAKPYSYSILYDRAPKHTYSLYQICDPNADPSRVVDAAAQEEGPAR